MRQSSYNANGNVGVGTNNPSDIFTVKKDGANQILARFKTDLGTNNGRAIAKHS